MASSSLRLIVALALCACGDPGGSSSTASSSSGESSGGGSSGGLTTAATSGSTAATTGGSTGSLMRCESLCRSDADCEYMGGDIGFRCLAGACVYPACAGDEPCVAELSGWLQPCAGAGECQALQACVDVDGQGRCANLSESFPCADFGLQPIERPTVEGGTALVCGNPDVVCAEGECFDPCKEDLECAPVMGHPTCEVATGACVCTSDVDCLMAQVPGFVTCLDGRCGCRKDADCEGGTNVDTCYEGACGCSSDATCTAMIFDGGSLACK